MTKYLVVAHQTAGSLELLQKLKELAGADQRAEFILLIPATPPNHLLAWTEGESESLALNAGESARKVLEEAGLNIGGVIVGDASPGLAVDDEFIQHPHYDAIVVCTFPLRISRWLGLDLPRKLRRKYSIPVMHVVAESSMASSSPPRA